MFLPSVLFISQLAIVVFPLVNTAVVHADSSKRFAEELIKLREEVEELSVELERKKVSHQTRLRSLESQRAELQVELQREEVKIRKLEKRLARQRELTRQAGIGAQELKPVIFHALDDLESFIQEALPFKRQERLAEVAELKVQVQTDVLAPHKAMNRLWSLYEDEIRLASENGLYRQAIQLNGKEQLADIARLGMVMMYFRTGDGEYGRVKNTNGQWQYEILPTHAAQDRVEILFDSLNKQIRMGYFTLPNALLDAAIIEDQR